MSLYLQIFTQYKYDAEFKARRKNSSGLSNVDKDCAAGAPLLKAFNVPFPVQVGP